MKYAKKCERFLFPDTYIYAHVPHASRMSRARVTHGMFITLSWRVQNPVEGRSNEHQASV